MPFPRVLKDMLSLPTAAFVEHAVLGYIRRLAERLPGVTLTEDRYGNLLAHYRHEPLGVPPLVFTAHTDHPGFVATAMRGTRQVEADFRGWVEASYFPRTRVRFWSRGRWIPATVREVLKTADVYRPIGRSARPEKVLLNVSAPVEPGSPGMWNLPEPAVRGGRVYARGCDDIAGAAAIAALLERLSRKRACADVYALFTRAEEVGFVGAIGAAKAGTIPRDLPVIAIETSKELPNARIGDGPILRVGDKMSVFTPSVTDFCYRVAQDLAKRRKSFRFQRKLMDGGSCESTAYLAYGYATTGMCLALGNYHNMDTQRGRIAAEYVGLTDWQQLVDWFEALALDERGYVPDDSAARELMEKRFAEYQSFF